MNLREVGAAELRALAEKYREMQRLRQRRVGAEARAELIALARRFPGALRELERLASDEIEARAEACEQAARGDRAAPWMRCMHGYHALMRLALSLRASGLPPLRSRAQAEGAGRAEVDEERAFAEAVLRPPEGRLVHVVLERLARELGAPVAEVRGYVLSGSCSQNSMRRGTL